MGFVYEISVIHRLVAGLVCCGRLISLARQRNTNAAYARPYIGRIEYRFQLSLYSIFSRTA